MSVIRKSVIMKQYLFFILSVAIISCGEKKDTTEEEQTTSQPVEEPAKPEAEEELVEALANPMENKGIGPVKQVELGPVDQAMADEGKEIFEGYCAHCHKTDKRYVGPALKEVTTRRSPEWIMNMIINPEVMVKEDPIAQALLKEYMSPMANQGITEEQARKILEYFRTLSDAQKVE